MKNENDNEIIKNLVKDVPGGLGIYHFYLDGRLEQVYLNDGYYSMLGIERKNRDEFLGFFTQNAVHPEDIDHLKEEVKKGISENKIVSDDIRIIDQNGNYVWVHVKVKIEEKVGDRYTIYASFSNIDKLKSVQLKLEASYRAMETASKSNGISFWLYYIDEKRMTQELQRKSAIGYPEVMENMPDVMCGTGEINPEDEVTFCKLYHEMENDAANAECTVRLLNHNTGKYEWRHIYCTRLDDAIYRKRVAIGFSLNVDLEQENRQRYENELQIRREMINSSVIYAQFNLSTHVVEEYYSKSYEEFGIKVGDRMDEVLGKKILDNIAEEDRQKVKNTLFIAPLLNEYKKGNSFVTIVYRRRLPGIGLRWIRTNVNIVERPESGDVIAFLNGQDIDMEKKDRLAVESILNEEIEYVVVLNVKNGQAHFAQIKEDFERLVSKETFDYDKVIGLVLETQVVKQDQIAFRNFFYIDSLREALEQEAVIKLAYRVKSKKGKILRKKTRAFYLDETHEEIVLIRRDITDIYEEQQRIQQQLQEAANTAVKANHAKSDFLSRMSHDMRTPLNAVLSFSSGEMVSHADEMTLRNYLNKIHTSGEYLLGIINDVLDMAKIEQKKMELNPEPYSQKEFVESMNSIIGELAKKKDIEFNIDVSKASLAWILTDKVRFNQVFVNLLSNAVKFTPNGGKVELLIEQHPIGDALAVPMSFIVRDNGIGMSKEFLPHAFDSFAQEYSKEMSEKTQGTGLGLSIVKKIVEMMDGTVRVESELGKGTTFTLELPMQATKAPELLQVEMQEKKNNDLEGLKILLCEDNFINVEIATKLLNRQGCHVTCAENGRQGLELFEESEEGYYDIVLMDIRMPVMNGLEAATAIRTLKRKDAGTIPIIAMTADAFDDDRQISKEAGMNAHMLKPIEPKKLYEAIRQTLKDREEM